jgi:predicted phage-related endonuclease
VSEHIDLDPVGAKLYDAYVLLGTQINDLTEKRERIREQLEARIGDATQARIDGTPVISWAWSKPGTRLDGKALAKDHPDIYAKYVRENKASRPFKLMDAS